MRVEVPEFKRCCCCIPLRYGILTWVYIRLVLNLLSLTILIILIMNIFTSSYGFIIIILGIIWVLTDIGFSLTLIVGAHKKNYKLLRVFYYFLLACIGIYNVLYILIIGNEIHSLKYINSYPDDTDIRQYLMKKFWENIIGYVANYVFTFAATGYLVLLVRSETLKLMRNCRFEFVNNAAAEETQCRMNLESEIVS